MTMVLPARADDGPAKGDPGGATTGTAADVMDGSGKTFVPPAPKDEDKTANAKKYADDKQAVEAFEKQKKVEPLAVQLADSVGQNRIAINLAWMLLTGFLVMFMQAGFALLETGLCRAKNASHTMFMNIFIYCIGIVAFYVCGFAFQMSAAGQGAIGGTAPLVSGNELTLGGWGICGLHGFFMQGNVYDVGVLGLFLFQMVFMDTAATIPTGAMAERWKLTAFAIYGFFMAGFLYPIFANWVWGGGWLSQLGTKAHLGHGYVDFAGSGVVHAVGGLCALAGAIVIGPRIGKYNSDGSANAIPAHHIPMAILGALILAFGWFGFNPGSTLAVSGGGNMRVAVVAFCTMVASASGGMAAGFYTWVKDGKPDLTMVANGLLAGLVAITAPSAFVSPAGAFWIGAVAGILVVVAALFVDHKLRVDDPVGAVAVHCCNGIWGMIAVGLFADGKWGDGLNGVSGNVTGLFYGGGASQLFAQLIAVVAVILWSGVGSYIFFKVQDAIMGIRVSPEAELEGLDMAELGLPAYHELISTRVSEY